MWNNLIFRKICENVSGLVSSLLRYYINCGTNIKIKLNKSLKYTMLCLMMRVRCKINNAFFFLPEIWYAIVTVLFLRLVVSITPIIEELLACYILVDTMLNFLFTMFHKLNTTKVLQPYPCWIESLFCQKADAQMSSLFIVWE